MVYAVFEINENTFVPARFESIGSIINLIMPILMVGAGIACLFMLVLGGLNWIKAGDNPENLKKAKEYFTYAIVGLFIVVLSFAIVKLIGVIINRPII